MAFQLNLNFRSTADFVTDGANSTYVLGENDPYPVSRAGSTFGYTVVGGDAKRDRNNAIDPRLAGTNFQSNNGTQMIFRLDLPQAGSYKIGMALGDDSFSQTYFYAEILDNVTSKFTLVDTDGTPAGSFIDVNGNQFTAANWPANQTFRTGIVFASTTLIMKIGSPTSQSSVTPIANLYVELESTVKSLGLLGVG